ncbi:hypothetical protein HHX47_DHR2000947 [Lentinula edodes]|nr:hypothetical protein HHX47_DHR2000947 [Lentinula edodes]
MTLARVEIVTKAILRQCKTVLKLGLCSRCEFSTNDSLSKGKLKVLPKQAEPTSVDANRSRGKHIDGSETLDEGIYMTDTTGGSDEGDVDDDSATDEVEDVEVYNQISLIPDGKARRDALRLTKKKAKSLPTVTAYASAMKRFEVEKLSPEDAGMEDLNYYYANYSRLHIQFEKLISNIIAESKEIPELICETGKIGMPHNGSILDKLYVDTIATSDDEN